MSKRGTIATYTSPHASYKRRFLTSLQRFSDSFAIDKETGCWNWIKAHRERYGVFWLNKKHSKANRASWILHYGAIPIGLCVLHRCDNASCVNPNHLFLGTFKDNTADMIRKGRDLPTRVLRRGENSNFARLTTKQAREVFLAKGSQGAIAARYGITQVAVSKIKLRKNWAHFTKDL